MDKLKSDNDVNNDVDNTDSIDELMPTSDVVLSKGTEKLRILQKLKVAKQQPFFTKVTQHLAEQINLMSGTSIVVTESNILSQINKAGLKNVTKWLNAHDYNVLASERNNTIVHIRIVATSGDAYFKLSHLQ